MRASKLGMTPFTVFSFLIDQKGRVIQETEWGDFNDYNKAKEVVNMYQN